MNIDQVDLTAPVFRDNPSGWQSPTDLSEGFMLAWALEMGARRRVDPDNPMAQHVLNALPPMFHWDALGEMIRLPPGSAMFPDAGLTEQGRLTTVSITWMLFDELNSRWRLRPHDFQQSAEALSLATGGTDRRSIYKDRSADLSKCLLADRISRTYSDVETLTDGEAWCVTGDSDLLRPDPRGSRVIPFTIGGNYTPLNIVSYIFEVSVWSSAQVLTELLSTEAVVERYDHRREVIEEVLQRGAERADMRAQLPPIQRPSFSLWPGWPE